MISVSVGWEISNIHNDGADVYVPLANAITLEAIQVDVSMEFPSGGSGFAEVLAQGWVTTGNPTFSTGSQGYITGPFPSNTDFGTAGQYIPSGSGITIAGSGKPVPGALFSIILKTYAPASAQRGDRYPSPELTNLCW